MDQNSEDAPEIPRTERPPRLNAVEVLLAAEEVNIFPNENMAPTPPSPPDPHQFALPSMNDESRLGRLSAEETEASMDECEYYPELQDLAQHGPWLEMPSPRFDESPFDMPEIPLERPHCPVPNNRMFMLPHIFNPEVFPQPPNTPYNYSPTVPDDQNFSLPSPDSSSVPETRRPNCPVPNSHLHFGLTHRCQPPTGNPPAPPRVFNFNEPGPSHRRNTPVPGGLSTAPPLPPLSVEIPRSIDLTSQQMTNLREELRRVSSVFSRLATIVHRKNCAPIPRTTRNRYNPFGSVTGASSRMRGSNAEASNFGPTKAKQLKTKQTIVKSSKPKVSNTVQPGAAQPGATQPNATQPNATQPAAAQPAATQAAATQTGAARPGAAQPGAALPRAAQPSIGLITIAPPTVPPTPGRSSNLRLDILTPSMLRYNGRRHAFVQTDPPRFNSFAGMFRARSSTDTDDQLDENGNITSPKPNLKRRHSDSDS